VEAGYGAGACTSVDQRSISSPRFSKTNPLFIRCISVDPRSISSSRFSKNKSRPNQLH
jgi:hypothetical protein